MIKKYIIEIGRIIQLIFHPLIGIKEVLREKSDENNYITGILFLIASLIIILILVGKNL